MSKLIDTTNYWHNGGDSYTSKITVKNYTVENDFAFVKRTFFVCFLILLIFGIYRSYINHDSSWFTFSDFLNAIKNMPNVLDSLVIKINNFDLFIFIPESTYNLPIIGEFISFLNGLNTLVKYLTTAILSAFDYLLYFIGLLF